MTLVGGFGCLELVLYGIASITVKLSTNESKAWISLSDRVYADMVSDGFLFYLDPSLSYRVIFHDPRFYHIVSNTLTFPRIWLEYKSGRNMEPGHYEWFYITVTQHHLLNRSEWVTVEV